MSSASVPLEWFRSGLRDRGWLEGRNLVIEARAGDRELARDFAAELVQLKVDVIVTLGPMISIIQSEAGSIPMVFAMNGDPVEAKFVSSYSRPGGDLTGITALADELAGKRLGLLKEALPGVTRVAILANDAHPGMQRELRSLLVRAEEVIQ